MARRPAQEIADALRTELQAGNVRALTRLESLCLEEETLSAAATSSRHAQEA